MDDIKKAYAWREALELSKRLVQICEEFSDADTNVLVWHLRNSVVDIPSMIAADLQADRWATMDPVIRLATQLELVRRIYPAIETGPAEERLDKLMKRMQSEQFTERKPEKERPAKDSKDSKEEPPADTDGDEAPESSSQSNGSTTVSVSKVDGVQHAVTSIDPSQSATVLPIQED
jgi:hypothetical protein